MHQKSSYGSQKWSPWTPNPSTCSIEPEYEVPFHYERFGGVRHDFIDPNSGGRFPAFSVPTYATAIADYSTVLPPLQPMRPTNQGMALHPRFQDNTAEAAENISQRMFIDASCPSRKTSNMTGIQPASVEVERNEGQEYTCHCPVNNSTLSSPSTQVLAEAAYNKAQSYTRVPVDGLLNSIYSQPVFSPAPNQNMPPQAQESEILAACSRANVNTHMYNTSPSRIQSLSTSFTTSSSTLRPESHSQAQFTVTEQRCFLLNTLYDICVNATASHLRSLLPRHRHRAKRWEPYPTRSSYRQGSSFLDANTRNAGRAPSLMDNISTISTHLWRKARDDAMVPHRAEADAVREMRDLYAWGELVVRGMESDGLLDVDEELEEGEISGKESVSTFVGGGGWRERGRGEGRVTPLRVGSAGKRICEWAGQREAWDSCQSVDDELRRLGEVEGKRKEGWTVVEVGDGEESSIS